MAGPLPPVPGWPLARDSLRGGGEEIDMQLSWPFSGHGWGLPPPSHVLNQNRRTKMNLHPLRGG
jgi:hypothetical protein